MSRQSSTPSDAQARLLAGLRDHRHEDDRVLMLSDSTHRRVLLYVERVAGEVPGRYIPPVVFSGLFDTPGETQILLRPANVPEILRSTLQAATRKGWVTTKPGVVVSSPCIGVCWGRVQDHECTEVEITDDGRIAVGLWQQRKLQASPVDLILNGEDRIVVELAEQATRLGFVLAPMSDQAKAHARKLARGPWVQRGHIGAGVRSVKPTGLAVVEVNPDRADIA